MQTKRPIRLTRRLVVRLFIAAVALIASALLTELALETRDVVQYMSGQTFATVGDAHIPYRLLGTKRPGASVEFLSDLNRNIEQADNFQWQCRVRCPPSPTIATASVKALRRTAQG
jgi:hypothetical protein